MTCMALFKLKKQEEKMQETSQEKTKGSFLDMSVHHSPEANPQLTLARTKSGRLKMLIVLLLCAAPVVASYITYYFVRPEGRLNYGELIEPQKPIPSLIAHDLNGQAVNLQTLKDQWLLISVAGGACDSQCKHHLYLQRQLREGLGKDKDRVDWVWLVTDDAVIDPALLPALKTATVLRIPMNELATWLNAKNQNQLSDHLYLVDPIGNWMMRFPMQLDMKNAAKVKKDLEKVLRSTASWDTEGRVSDNQNKTIK